MPVMIQFPDGSTVEGDDATEALRQLLGGWNPDKLSALKRVLAKRCEQITGVMPDVDFSDEDFVDRLDSYGFWVVQRR